MEITIRPFRETDIPDKVRWINDPANNRFLHYDLPLKEAGTQAWFRRIKDAPDRRDFVILAGGVPCGVTGLLHIDRIRKEAEYYITMGEPALKRKGIAFAASKLLLDFAFGPLGLRTVYLVTEPENLPARNLFRKLGFSEAGLLERYYPNGNDAVRCELRFTE